MEIAKQSCLLGVVLWLFLLLGIWQALFADAKMSEMPERGRSLQIGEDNEEKTEASGRNGRRQLEGNCSDGECDISGGLLDGGGSGGRRLVETEGLTIGEPMSELWENVKAHIPTNDKKQDSGEGFQKFENDILGRILEDIQGEEAATAGVRLEDLIAYRQYRETLKKDELVDGVKRWGDLENKMGGKEQVAIEVKRMLTWQNINAATPDKLSLWMYRTYLLEKIQSLWQAKSSFKNLFSVPDEVRRNLVWFGDDDKTKAFLADHSGHCFRYSQDIPGATASEPVTRPLPSKMDSVVSITEVSATRLLSCELCFIVQALLPTAYLHRIPEESMTFPRLDDEQAFRNVCIERLDVNVLVSAAMATAVQSGDYAAVVMYWQVKELLQTQNSAGLPCADILTWEGAELYFDPERISGLPQHFVDKTFNTPSQSSSALLKYPWHGCWLFTHSKKQHDEGQGSGDGQKAISDYIPIAAYGDTSFQRVAWEPDNLRGWYFRGFGYAWLTALGDTMDFVDLPQTRSQPMWPGYPPQSGSQPNPPVWPGYAKDIRTVKALAEEGKVEGEESRLALTAEWYSRIIVDLLKGLTVKTLTGVVGSPSVLAEASLSVANNFEKSHPPSSTFARHPNGRNTHPTARYVNVQNYQYIKENVRRCIPTVGGIRTMEEMEDFMRCHACFLFQNLLPTLYFTDILSKHYVHLPLRVLPPDDLPKGDGGQSPPPSAVEIDSLFFCSYCREEIEHWAWRGHHALLFSRMLSDDMVRLIPPLRPAAWKGGEGGKKGEEEEEVPVKLSCSRALGDSYFEKAGWGGCWEILKSGGSDFLKTFKRSQKYVPSKNYIYQLPLSFRPPTDDKESVLKEPGSHRFDRLPKPIDKEDKGVKGCDKGFFDKAMEKFKDVTSSPLFVYDFKKWYAEFLKCTIKLLQRNQAGKGAGRT
eukprot:GHVS01080595.1.p1 GENE.GHVS01080595.1~~GHVS01080595.1.p1  ORF type:complete len:928 (-),score=127.50 GHVS01080595.1:862-3645(-)